MQIETLRKADDFKQGHLNLVQHFLKKGCFFFCCRFRNRKNDYRQFFRLRTNKKSN